MRGPEIRPMAEADIPAAARLEAACFSTPWSEDAFRSAFAGGVTRFFAAEEAGRVVGYIGLQMIWDEGFVTNLAVWPGSRRQGIGRALLEAALEAGREAGLATLSLEVRPSNLPALSLYRQKGFQEAGRRKNFYSKPPEDGLIMTYTYTNAKEASARADTNRP